MSFIDPTRIFNVTAQDVIGQWSPEYQNKLRREREAFEDEATRRQREAAQYRIQQDYQNALLQQMQRPQYRDVPISQEAYMRQNALAPQAIQPTPQGMKPDAATAFQAEQRAMFQKQQEQENLAKYRQLQASGQLPTQREQVSASMPQNIGEALFYKAKAKEQFDSYYGPAMKSAYTNGDDETRKRLVEEAYRSGNPELAQLAGVYDNMEFTGKGESAVEVDLRTPESAGRFYTANKAFFDEKGVGPSDIMGGQFVVKYKGSTPIDFKRVDKETKAAKREPTTAPFAINPKNIDNLLKRATPGTLPHESLLAMKKDFESHPKTAKPVNAVVEEEYDPASDTMRIKKISEQVVPGSPTVKLNVGDSGNEMQVGVTSDGIALFKDKKHTGAPYYYSKDNKGNEIRVPYYGERYTAASTPGLAMQTEEKLTPAEKIANYKYFSSPAGQTVIRRTNSVYDALDLAIARAKKVPDIGNTPSNAVARPILEAFGNVDIAIDNLANMAVADEFNQIMGGGKGAVEYFKQVKSKLSANMPVASRIKLYEDAAKFIATRQKANVAGTPLEKRTNAMLKRMGVETSKEKQSHGEIVERRRTSNGRILVKYSDNHIAYEGE